MLVALFFAIHAVRSGQQMYWLIILFSFPLLGSVVYFLVIYLPNSRLEHGASKAVAAAARSLDPTRELREARAAFEYTPTAQNQMRLALAQKSRASAPDLRHAEEPLHALGAPTRRLSRPASTVLRRPHVVTFESSPRRRPPGLLHAGCGGGYRARPVARRPAGVALPARLVGRVRGVSVRSHPRARCTAARARRRACGRRAHRHRLLPVLRRIAVGLRPRSGPHTGLRAAHPDGPPAGANLLIMVYSHAGFAALWQPVLVGVASLAVVAFIWSRLVPGLVHYPVVWLDKSPPSVLWGGWSE